VDAVFEGGSHQGGGMSTSQWLAEAATEAQREAKAFSDRGLMEAIYILLRRNELMQQNAVGRAYGQAVTGEVK
jgi:hypothetical protein